MAQRVDETVHAGDLRVYLAPMRRRHLRPVLRIEEKVYPRPWTMGLFLSELAFRDTRRYLVARVDVGVVGYSGIMLTDEEAHVTTIAVDPAWHRRGIATRLLALQAIQAIDAGCNALTLEVRVSNTGAQELYRQFGFQPAGIRRNYYRESNEDALVMWAHDIDSPEYRLRLRALQQSLPGETIVDPALVSITGGG